MSEKGKEGGSIALLPPEYTQAAGEIVEVLVKHEIDPEQYDRLFRIARMLLDVKFDGSSPLERLSKVFTTAVEQDPLRAVVTAQQILQTFLQAGTSPPAPAPAGVVFPVEAARATSPIPSTVMSPDPDTCEAYVVVFVSPDGMLRDAGVFSERTPTVTDGSRTFVACSGRGRTFDEARVNALWHYRYGHADLSSVVPATSLFAEGRA